MGTDSRGFNDFVFEIYPNEEYPKDCLKHSDFILRSGEKKIDASLNRICLNLISLRCIERLDLDFMFDFLPVHENDVDLFIFGAKLINIKTIDGKHTIKNFFYVIGNMKEDLVLSQRSCWELGLKDWFTPVLSCPEDDEDF